MVKQASINNVIMICVVDRFTVCLPEPDRSLARMSMPGPMAPFLDPLVDDPDPLRVLTKIDRRTTCSVRMVPVSTTRIERRDSRSGWECRVSFHRLTPAPSIGARRVCGSLHQRDALAIAARDPDEQVGLPRLIGHDHLTSPRYIRAKMRASSRLVMDVGRYSHPHDDDANEPIKAGRRRSRCTRSQSTTT